MGSLPSGKNYLEIFAAGRKALMMETGASQVAVGFSLLSWNDQMENPSRDGMDQRPYLLFSSCFPAKKRKSKSPEYIDLYAQKLLGYAASFNKYRLCA